MLPRNLSSQVLRNFSTKQRVLDSHFHQAYSNVCDYEWMPNYDEKYNRPAGSFNREFPAEHYRGLTAGPHKDFDVQACFYMECSYGSDDSTYKNQIAEAKLVQKLCQNDPKFFRGYIAQIDVSKGKKFVNDFLNEMRDSEGKLCPYLKGARRVMQSYPIEMATDKQFLQGIEALHENGLTWDINCSQLHHKLLLEMQKRFPNMKFTLDHLGLNETGLLDIKEPLKMFEETCALLAENKNLVCKLGDIEEFFVEPKPYLEVAIKNFGFERCLAESNYFVNIAMGDDYWYAFEVQKEVCEKLGASKEDLDKVFFTNCENHYGI